MNREGVYEHTLFVSGMRKAAMQHDFASSIVGLAFGEIKDTKLFEVLVC
jgi:hypothetical protein